MGILRRGYTSYASASNVRDYDWLLLLQITPPKKLFIFAVGCAVVVWTVKICMQLYCFLLHCFWLHCMLWSLGHRIRGSHKPNPVPCMHAIVKHWATANVRGLDTCIGRGKNMATVSYKNWASDLSQWTQWVVSSVSWCSITQDIPLSVLSWLEN